MDLQGLLLLGNRTGVWTRSECEHKEGKWSPPAWVFLSRPLQALVGQEVSNWLARYGLDLNSVLSLVFLLLEDLWKIKCGLRFWKEALP